jgi:hypothetical protein
MKYKLIAYISLLFSLVCTVKGNCRIYESYEKTLEIDKRFPTYQISIIESENMIWTGLSDPKICKFNNKCQIFGYCSKKNDSVKKAFMLSNNILSYFDLPDFRYYNTTHEAVNQIGHFFLTDLNSSYLCNMETGEKEKIDLPVGMRPFVTSLNDEDEIIFNQYYQEYYIWKKGIIEILGNPKAIKEELEQFGFRKIKNICLCEKNSKGEMIGYFENVSNEYFFWDGQLHYIPNSNKNSFFDFHINDAGVVMLSDGTQGPTSLWHKDVGIIDEIPNFHGIKINNASTILGYFRKGTKEVPAIWKNGRVFTIAELLGVEDLSKIPIFQRPSMSLPGHLILDINDNDQILSNCWIENRLYPCIIEPVKNQL